MLNEAMEIMTTARKMKLISLPLELIMQVLKKLVVYYVMPLVFQEVLRPWCTKAGMINNSLKKH